MGGNPKYSGILYRDQCRETLTLLRSEEILSVTVKYGIIYCSKLIQSAKI